MGLDKKDIYNKIANKELTVQEGKKLLEQLEQTTKQPNTSPAENQTSKKLIDILASTVHKQTTEIKSEVGFYEQGLDSNDLLNYVKELEKELGEELYPTLLFEYTTIDKLSDFINTEYPGKLTESSTLTIKQATKIDSIIEQELKSMFSKYISRSPDKIDITDGFYEQGLDSNDLLKFVKELENRLEEELYPTLLFEYTNIQELSIFLKENYSNIFNIETKKDIKNKKSISHDKTFKKITPNKYASKKEENIQEPKTVPPKDVAIIGLSGRYPQADDIYQFWENLKAGRDCITEIPEERWDHSKYFNPDKNHKGTTYSKWGGFINDVDKFDPLFFNISPREATLIDPQERLFLEECWKVIENAGYKRENLGTDKVGVFTGVMYGDYQLFGLNESQSEKPSAFYASIANRISYLFNFHGPSIALDTMCSSSLTTIHLAYRSILNGECDMAIAGGVNVTIHPNKYLRLAQQNFLSSDGRCRAFGKDGDGYVPGEGVGAVLLKPLSMAIKDNDYIYAVIKGSSINHGGKASGGTVPNPNAQAELITEAINASEISPETISYLEAHGTGTSLGDPIEITGLTKAYKNYTNKKQYCPIGSVKSNIGHLESAAGISGITKLLLQLKYKKLVPSIHSDELNPNINFKNSPFYVQHKLEEWKRPIVEGKECPRRAGISGFGAGGSNAHIILEEYENTAPQKNKTEEQLIILSAKTEESLKGYVENLLYYLRKEEQTDIRIEDIAYTLATGRNEMKTRLAFIASSNEKLIDNLIKFISDSSSEDTFKGQAHENKNDNIRDLLKTRNLHKIAKLWCSGVDIDWKTFYNEYKFKKINLPTYSFLKERYWIKKPKEKKNNTYLYELKWKKAEISPSSIVKDKQSILIFAQNKELYSKLTKEIKDRNIFLIIFGEKYTNKGNKYIIRSNNAKDYDKLFADLVNNNMSISNIIHCGGNEYKQYDISNMDDMFDISIGSIFFIIQSISKRQIKHKIKVNYIINDSNINPMFEAVAGYSKSIQMIVPNIIIHTVKIPKVKDTYQNIINEMVNYSLRESEIYYDANGDRFVKTNELITSLTKRIDNTSFKKNETYIITGGLGGLGFIFAEHLIKKYHINLILTGRSELSQEKKSKLDLLNNNNKKAIYIQANAADYNDMIKVVNEAENNFGSVDCIVHSAGAVDDKKIIEKNIVQFKNKLNAKLAGSTTLWKIINDKKINNLILFSSTSAILGDFGQCDYSIGNKFLDHYGAYLNNNSTKNIKVINWPLWREGGMHLNRDAEELYLKTTGLTYLETQKGKELFDNILNSDNSQVIIIPGNKAKIDNLLAIYDAIKKQSKLQKVKIENNTSINSLIREEISNILEIPIENIDINTNFVDFGFDSVTLTEFSNRITSSLNTQIPTSLFFDYPNVQSLANHLESKKINIQSTYNTQDNIVKKVGNSYEKMEEDIKRLISSILQINIEKLIDDENVANFGFDSITLTEFSKQLEKHFKVEVAPSLFFEYSTIASLTNYFMKVVRNIDSTEIETKIDNSNVTSIISVIGVSEEDIKPDKKQRYWLTPKSINKISGYNISLQSEKIKKLLLKYKSIRLLIKLSSNTEMEVTVSGIGQPIVVITGLGQLSSGWFKQVRKLRKENQVIIIHNPGQGLSSAVKDVSLEEMDRIYIEAISKLNPNKPLPLAAISFGGLLSLYFAYKHPELFSKLILISTPYHYENKEYKENNTLYEAAQRDLERIIKEGKSEDVLKNKNKYHKQITKSESMNPLMAVKYAETFLNNVDTKPFLGKIKAQTLVIHGACDDIVEIEEGEVINEYIPNSTLIKIPDAGHFPTITHSKLINKLISNFIKK